MKRIALVLLLFRSICVLSQAVPEKTNPKVRAITAFVRFDRTNFLKQIEDTLVILHRAESEFTSSGYDVETIRITSTSRRARVRTFGRTSPRLFEEVR